MKILPQQFKKTGFQFTQVKRDGLIALFSKRKPQHSKDNFEVVMIQQHGEYFIGGVTIPAREALPSSNSWGRDGFTYTTLDAAQKKFDQLMAIELEDPVELVSSGGSALLAKQS